MDGEVLSADDRARLRTLAEAAREDPWMDGWWASDAAGWATRTVGIVEVGDHIGAFSPDVALALLDAADRLAGLPDALDGDVALYGEIESRIESGTFGCADDVQDIFVRWLRAALLAPAAAEDAS